MAVSELAASSGKLCHGANRIPNGIVDCARSLREPSDCARMNTQTLSWVVPPQPFDAGGFRLSAVNRNPDRGILPFHSPTGAEHPAHLYRLRFSPTRRERELLSRSTICSAFVSGWRVHQVVVPTTSHCVPQTFYLLPLILHAELLPAQNRQDANERHTDARAGCEPAKLGSAGPQ